MADVLPFSPRMPGDRRQLTCALANLADHLEQILSSLRKSMALLERAEILPDVLDELTQAAGRANDLADWLNVVRRQLPQLPAERLTPAVTPLVTELDSLDRQAQSILSALPGRIQALMRRG